MDDLPAGFHKIEGFHGVGRDIYATRHDSGTWSILSKGVGEKHWYPGKSYASEAKMMEGFHDMIEALQMDGYKPEPLIIMESNPNYGRF